MAVGGARFGFAQRRLLSHQAAGQRDVARGEDVQRQPQVLEHAGVESPQLGHALGREGIAVPDLLGGELHQVLVDDVADMLEVRREGQDLDIAPAVLLAEFVARDLDEVELDRLVELVDGVVGRLDRLHRLGIVALQDVDGLAQHVAHAIAEVQRLAQRAAQRLGRRIEHVGIEMPGLAGIVGDRLVGQQAAAGPGDDVDQRQEDQRGEHIERGMEVDRQARRRGIDQRQPIDGLAEEGQQRDADDGARHQVGERHAAGGDVGARLRHVGRQRAADIGADHQGQRELGLDQAAAGEGHDQKHDRQAGMREPGGERADHDGDHVLVLQALQHRHEGGRAAQGLRRQRQELQRQQHQAEPDGDAAEMARLVLFARQEGDDAGADQQRRHPAEVERQDLGRDGGADVGAQHDGEGDRQRDQAAAGEGGDQQRGGRARLQQAGDGDAA